MACKTYRDISSIVSTPVVFARASTSRPDGHETVDVRFILSIGHTTSSLSFVLPRLTPEIFYLSLR